MKIKKEPIRIMQKHLQVLRKINGWTAEELGQKLGVTKQTISNFENNKVEMTKTQYIALRTILEYEMRIVDENNVLKTVMYILFYSPINCCDDEYENVNDALNNIAAAAVGGVSGTQLSILATTILSPLNVLRGVNIEQAISVMAYKWLEELEEGDFENAEG